LNCPQCGLSLTAKPAWLTIDYCPRCLARFGAAVPLFAALPTGDLFPSGDERDGPQALPRAADRGTG
jgi:hypothetical protein